MVCDLWCVCVCVCVGGGGGMCEGVCRGVGTLIRISERANRFHRLSILCVCVCVCVACVCVCVHVCVCVCVCLCESV